MATVGVNRIGDYEDQELLRPIMAEVIRQVDEQSGRGGSFAQYFKPWRAVDGLVDRKR